MKDTHIKNWFSVIVVTLMLVGGGASYAAHQQTYYRGEEPVSEISDEDISFAPETVSFEEKISETAPLLQTSVLTSEKPSTAEYVSSAHCKKNEVPIISGGKVTDCAPDTAAAPTSAPGPKVKILTP